MGIKIGIVNFTYETKGSDPERKYLNGGAISKDANRYINTFSYQRIESFYTEAEEVINAMKQDGAEFISFYMHWGEEYQLSANTWQKSIAQKLSNLGVDIIIGSHPHVIEPVELIHSEDGQNTTVCLYSTGNAILRKRTDEKLNIVDSSKLYFVIQDYFKGSILKNESLVNNLILFFASWTAISFVR